MIIATELELGDVIEFSSLNPKRFQPHSGSGVVSRFSIDRPHLVVVRTAVPVAVDVPSTTGEGTEKMILGNTIVEIEIDDRTHAITRSVRSAHAESEAD